MTKDEKTQEKRDRKRYETFKLKWMAEHGYSLIDFLSKINDCYEKLQAKEPVFKGCLYDNTLDIWDALDLFEDTGFKGGMIYPCFDEWLDNECIEDNVEEVKCGQWVVDGFDETYNCYEAHCSNCGVELEMNFDGDKPYIDLNTAYCRCCGAKMNGWCEDEDYD